MKKIFLLILLSISIRGYSQGPYSLSINEYKSIDLKLTKSNRYSDPDSFKKTSLAVFFAGLAFTSAIILEGNKHYGSYVNNPNNSSQVIYVVPPFWSQTPRQILFCAGIGLTFTGGLMSLASIR